jgi:hypothetical protein
MFVYRTPDLLRPRPALLPSTMPISHQGWHPQGMGTGRDIPYPYPSPSILAVTHTRQWVQVFFIPDTRRVNGYPLVKIPKLTNTSN